MWKSYLSITLPPAAAMMTLRKFSGTRGAIRCRPLFYEEQATAKKLRCTERVTLPHRPFLIRAAAAPQHGEAFSYLFFNFNMFDKHGPWRTRIYLDINQFAFS